MTVSSDDQRAAVAAFAVEMSKSHAQMSAAFAKLAQAFGAHVAPVGQATSVVTPVSASTWNERVLKQSLILHEIVKRGGNVPQTVWYEIAAQHGYNGRGLSGFFRSNGAGLLELRKDKRAYITKRGRERLKQNQERVDAYLAAQHSDGAAAVAVG